MYLRLYNVTAPQRKINKENYMTEKGVVNIHFLDTENLSTPKVVLGTTNISNIIGTNYAYSAELGRYYWVDQIDEHKGGLITLSLRVDVLMTYKPYLMDNARQFFVVRSSSEQPSMIPDANLPLYPYKQLRTVKFSENPFFRNFTEYTPCFVLNIAGK